MTEQEKIELVADALDMEASELSMDMKLQDLAEYDSMAKLSIIVLMDEEFEKKLTGEEMAKFETVADIISFASK